MPPAPSLPHPAAHKRRWLTRGARAALQRRAAKAREVSDRDACIVAVRLINRSYRRLKPPCRG